MHAWLRLPAMKHCLALHCMQHASPRVPAFHWSARCSVKPLPLVGMRGMLTGALGVPGYRRQLAAPAHLPLDQCPRPAL